MGTSDATEAASVTASDSGGASSPLPRVSRMKFERIAERRTLVIPFPPLVRLPPSIPFLSDTPVAFDRALYKASTGSIKSTDYLLGALGFLVIAALGPEAWNDWSVTQWTDALAQRWPPRPPDSELQALLDQAAARGDIARRIDLHAPDPDADALVEPFNIGVIDSMLGHPRAFDEADLLAAALRFMAAHWEGSMLVGIAAQWAWPPSLDLDRRAVTVGVLSTLFLLADVPLAQAARHHLSYLHMEYGEDPFFANALRENFRALGAAESLLDDCAAELGIPLPRG